MTRTFLALVLSCAALGGGARAQVHYSCDDPVGPISTCRDSNGDMYTVVHDPMGETITDNRGRMSRVQTDPFGETTIQNSDGSQARGQTDAFGDTTYEDDHGRQTHCRPSPIAMPGQTEEDCQ